MARLRAKHIDWLRSFVILTILLRAPAAWLAYSTPVYEVSPDLFEIPLVGSISLLLILADLVLLLSLLAMAGLLPLGKWGVLASFVFYAAAALENQTASLQPWVGFFRQLSLIPLIAATGLSFYSPFIRRASEEGILERFASRSSSSRGYFSGGW